MHSPHLQFNISTKTKMSQLSGTSNIYKKLYAEETYNTSGVQMYFHHSYKFASFFHNMTFFLIFSKAIRDIGNIIAASDKPN